MNSMKMRLSYSLVATFSVVTMLLIIPTVFSYTLLETMAIVAAGGQAEYCNPGRCCQPCPPPPPAPSPPPPSPPPPPPPSPPPPSPPPPRSPPPPSPPPPRSPPPPSPPPPRSPPPPSPPPPRSPPPPSPPPPRSPPPPSPPPPRSPPPPSPPPPRSPPPPSPPPPRSPPPPSPPPPSPPPPSPPPPRSPPPPSPPPPRSPPPPPPRSPPPPPPSPPPSQDITEIINSTTLFDKLLVNRNDLSCPARGFYTYDAFVEAARSFKGFGTTGDIDRRKREVAAFLAQTSHVTYGDSTVISVNPYEWGYCNKTEADHGTNCVNSTEWPCTPGKKYYGRGPFQIKYNYNYGPCGKAIGKNLLVNPDLVANDRVISFKSALWFWMTPQASKPSCHDAILEIWKPSPQDKENNRLPGFGVTTNIINGRAECGHGSDTREENRVGFYLRYCDILRVDAGDNIECGDQGPFDNSLKSMYNKLS